MGTLQITEYLTSGGHITGRFWTTEFVIAQDAFHAIDAPNARSEATRLLATPIVIYMRASSPSDESGDADLVKQCFDAVDQLTAWIEKHRAVHSARCVDCNTQL